MKRIPKALLTILIVLLLGGLSVAQAETITACGITVDRDAEAIDFDKRTVRDLDELCDMIDQMPNLKKVDMYRTYLSMKEMERLYTAYPQIEWGWVLRIGEHDLRTDDEAFSTFHSVDPEVLHTQNQFKILKYCHHLQALDFGHNNVTDLSFLYDLPELKILIAAVQWEIGSIEPIGSLHDLMYLELFNAGVTDVTPLAGLDKLEDLNLCYNRNLEDISPLYENGALPNLKRFWCGYTKVSEEQKAAMEAAHPDCMFDWTSVPTKGGWRRNTRYDALMQVFRTRRYEPLPEPVWHEYTETN